MSKRWIDDGNEVAEVWWPDLNPIKKLVWYWTAKSLGCRIYKAPPKDSSGGGE